MESEQIHCRIDKKTTSFQRWNRRGGYDSKIFDSQGYDRGEGHDHDWGGGHVDDERK
jgi:hypothetical protein